MKRNKKILFIVLAFILLLGPAAAPTPVWAGSSGAASAGNNTVGLSSASGVDLSSTPVIVGTGITVTITATGDRQVADGLAGGGTRYIPVNWESNELVSGTTAGGIFTSTGGIYTADYTTSTAPASGFYTVTATFQLQTWNGSAWVDASTPDTKTATLYV